ncbi:MAG: Holliday junction resolvase [Methanomassiliicoccaceae archaeon]|nr:Holliday junction resolvase [Methanomassiliicoccaceae archaeon]
MAAAGDRYERELKHLLAGDEKTVKAMMKTCDDNEKRGYSMIMDNPFVVIRAAGSLGVDLVALRWDFSFPIEVKSSAEDSLRFTKNYRIMEQAEKMAEDCKRSSLIPIYAFRLKGYRGDPWRVFALPTDNMLKGKVRLVQRTVPPIGTNSNGNLVMKWDDGMKLSKFIEYLGTALTVNIENDASTAL